MQIISFLMLKSWIINFSRSKIFLIILLTILIDFNLFTTICLSPSKTDTLFLAILNLIRLIDRLQSRYMDLNMRKTWFRSAARSLEKYYARFCKFLILIVYLFDSFLNEFLPRVFLNLFLFEVVRENLSKSFVFCKISIPEIYIFFIGFLISWLQLWN